MKPTPEQSVTWFFTAARASGIMTFPADAESRVMDALAKASAKERKAIISGMNQSINVFTNLPGVWYRFIEINSALQAKGLPTLEEIDASVDRKQEKILRRGRIQNDEEFYLVKELLDGPGLELSKKTRIKLGKLMYAYETRPRTA